MYVANFPRLNTIFDTDYLYQNYDTCVDISALTRIKKWIQWNSLPDERE